MTIWSKELILYQTNDPKAMKLIKNLQAWLEHDKEYLKIQGIDADPMFLDKVLIDQRTGVYSFEQQKVENIAVITSKNKYLDGSMVFIKDNTIIGEMS